MLIATKKCSLFGDHLEISETTKAILINIIVSQAFALGILPPHLKCFYFMRMRNGGGRGQGGAARPAGRMQDQHVVDRATDAVESWGVSDAARF